MTAIQAISDPARLHFILLGEPGSGKSTFVNYLVYCLAKAELEPNGNWLQKLSGWNLDESLPVRVLIRELIAWAGGGRKGTAKVLWDFIRHDLEEHGFEDFFKQLQSHLQNQGGLVVLDGLDEVPDARWSRQFIKEIIEDLVRTCSLCRIIITCRPYAYERSAWKLLGFHQYTLAPFSSEQIKQFISSWYNAYKKVYPINDAQAGSKAGELVAATHMPNLFELAQRPLLLTLMATLHTSRGKLPEDRAGLYDECVALLLEYWERAKFITEGGEERPQQGILDALGVSRRQLEQALCHVAFEAHERQSKAQGRRPTIADISVEQLRKALVPNLNNSEEKANEVIPYIETRAGLLVRRGVDTYAFPHRTFQEFLAACYILGSEEFPSNLAELVSKDPEWWREVFLLAAGLLARSRHIGGAVALIDAFYNKGYTESYPIADSDAFTVMLAAQAAAEATLPVHVLGPGRFKDTLVNLQNWLIGIIQQETTIKRVEAGRLLNALGDSRPDVSSHIPALVDVPEGQFLMGIEQSDDNENEKPQHRVGLSAYRIGKYPVTNAQYRFFIEDSGYTRKHRDCWTDLGWKFIETSNISIPALWYDSTWNLDNHPVVGVSWYEAVAYCNWLTKTAPEKHKFRLPTEAEWEKAARGTDGRKWPWGNDFEWWNANTLASEINRTTAVGLFPKSPSPFDAFDMAGNVWEWCSSQWGSDLKTPSFKYPYRVDDGREEPNNADLRVMRGGSWNVPEKHAQCATRNRNYPHNRNNDVGFRVAASR